MVKVKILKSGKYALDSAIGPIVDFVADPNADNDEPAENPVQLERAHALKMIADDWAVAEELVEEDVDEEDDGDDEGLDDEPVVITAESARTALDTLVASVETDAEKKSLVQEWGEVQVNIKPSKSKSLENMILEICEGLSE